MIKYIKGKRTLMFALLATLSVVWMSVIFGFSSSDAEESTEQSNFVTEFLIKIFEDDYDTLNQNEKQLLIEKYDGVVRKLAHFGIFGVLGVLLYLTAGSLKWIPDSFAKPSYISLPLSWAFAAADEYHQTFVSGRSGQIKDVLIDSAGALCGTLFGIMVVVVVKKIKMRYFR